VGWQLGTTELSFVGLLGIPDNGCMELHNSLKNTNYMLGKGGIPRGILTDKTLESNECSPVN